MLHDALVRSPPKRISPALRRYDLIEFFFPVHFFYNKVLLQSRKRPVKHPC